MKNYKMKKITMIYILLISISLVSCENIETHCKSIDNLDKHLVKNWKRTFSIYTSSNNNNSFDQESIDMDESTILDDNSFSLDESIVLDDKNDIEADLYSKNNLPISRSRFSSGSFGTVRQIKLQSPKKNINEVAVKFIHLKAFLPGEKFVDHYRNRNKVLVSAEREIQNLILLKNLKNPFMYQFFGCFYETYDSDTSLYIVTESLEVSLESEDITNDNKKIGDLFKTWDYNTKLLIFWHIANQLNVLHENQLVHFDVKPANIMLKNVNDPKSRIVRVIDLGSAFKIDPEVHLAKKLEFENKLKLEKQSKNENESDSEEEPEYEDGREVFNTLQFSDNDMDSSKFDHSKNDVWGFALTMAYVYYGYDKVFEGTNVNMFQEGNNKITLMEKRVSNIMNLVQNDKSLIQNTISENANKENDEVRHNRKVTFVEKLKNHIQSSKKIIPSDHLELNSESKNKMSTGLFKKLDFQSKKKLQPLKNLDQNAMSKNILQNEGKSIKNSINLRKLAGKKDDKNLKDFKTPILSQKENMKAQLPKIGVLTKNQNSISKNPSKVILNNNRFSIVETSKKMIPGGDLIRSNMFSVKKLNPLNNVNNVLQIPQKVVLNKILNQGDSIFQLYSDMLNLERTKRPTMKEIKERIGKFISANGGVVPRDFTVEERKEYETDPFSFFKVI